MTVAWLSMTSDSLVSLGISSTGVFLMGGPQAAAPTINRPNMVARMDAPLVSFFRRRTVRFGDRHVTAIHARPGTLRHRRRCCRRIDGADAEHDPVAKEAPVGRRELIGEFVAQKHPHLGA